MAIRAFDADDPGTDNAALRYNIVRQSPDNPSSRMFYIDAENGYIITAISPALLDREVSRLKQNKTKLTKKKKKPRTCVDSCVVRSVGDAAICE